MIKPNFPNLQNLTNEDDLKWKMTLIGRLPKIAEFEYLSSHWSDLPQILNLGLYDQAKLSSCSNISNEDDLNCKMTSNGRLPKITKFEYLSNHWSDLPQTLNLDLYHQAKLS